MNNNISCYLTVNKTINFIIWGVFLIAIWLIPLEFLLFAIAFIPNYINIYSLIALGAVQGACLGLMIYQLRGHFRDDYPVFHLTFLINKERVEIRIRNQIYLLESWGNIKRIEIIQEVYSIPGSDKDLYKIRFFTSEVCREIRLFSLKVRGNNVKKIINVIENITKEYHLQVEMKQEKYGNYQNYFRELKQDLLVIRQLQKKKDNS